VLYSRKRIVGATASAATAGRRSVAKMIECARVDPSSGCQHVLRGETEDEVLAKAAEHAKEHGIREVTPELLERVRASIQEA
jgi:predicted small metal-binding protein